MNTRLLRKRHDPPAHPLIRLLRIVAGTIVVIVGMILAIPGVPGQGILTMLAGLWILSADVRLARRALVRMRIALRRTRNRYRRWRAESKGDAPS